MRIPLVDLRKQYQGIKDEIDEAIQQVLNETGFVLGSEVEKLEHSIARFHNTTCGVGVASGTDALLLALIACGIGKDDEVITTPFTFIATTEAICRVGAKPVFCDIDETTYNIDSKKIEEKITPSTRAILPVHLYGLSCNMEKILTLAREYNLKVIEDCAQAFGSEYKGERVGSFTDAGCLSFFPSKNLGAYGDGGMVVTDNEEMANHLKMLRNHGASNKYFCTMHGFNSRLDTIQAAVLRVKLRYIDRWIKDRQENAAFYNQLLSNTGIGIPVVPDYARHSFNYYTIRIKKNRDKVQKHLKENGIANAVYYPLCLHLQEVYTDLGYKPGDFPIAERVQNEVLSLPIYSELTHLDITEICRIIKQVV
ncbi:MAG: DegT/DnrJ/EryC1/StrS family aminotransferase [Thermodesulfobacteriota bacterium]|nr:DegT/DnrJ/EryC1/StrS family aminotransferase [Thermodesulfobacteriota bacterium]